MLKFLREDQVGAHFRSHKKSAWEVMIAVPFWGKDAAKMLGLSGEEKARIICNLDSPACNPHTIKALLSDGSAVRSNKRLHAKLYLTDDLLILGSSNASVNGLTLEGDNTTGLIEANIATDDPDMLETATDFFDGVWAESINVTPAMLRAAIARWENRPPPPPALKSTLLSACQHNPGLFRNVYVAAYDDTLSDESKARLRSLKKNTVANSPSSDVDIGDAFQTSDFRHAWGYGTYVKPGTWLIFLDMRRKVTYRGCAQVALNVRINAEESLAVALRGVVNVPELGRKFNIAATEKAALEQNGAKIFENVDDNGLISLADAVRLIGMR